MVGKCGEARSEARIILDERTECEIRDCGLIELPAVAEGTADICTLVEVKKRTGAEGGPVREVLAGGEDWRKYYLWRLKAPAR